MNLTPKQLEVLELIKKHRDEQGYSPTMKELSIELGISKVTVFERVEALIRKGALLREPNKARSLSIAEGIDLPNSGAMRFPLVGRIAAGMPIERCQDNDSLDLEEMFAPRVGQLNQTFALKVEGESMRDEGILEGDFVLVQQQSTAKNGDRVVALLPDGETTLKTFFVEDDGRIRLQPANPDFAPIIVKECQVQGVITGVLRSYH
ncbi:MAG: transcriptional repressor LexA [Phycisphaerales bacterium]|jgi:repressor LexA|nr:transcriptional repressor LexA [Phycisphaerales bacterium]MDP6692775.1 transcriptional repressor LexA [Phycisphaerales bacterium]